MGVTVYTTLTPKDFHRPQPLKKHPRQASTPGGMIGPTMDGHKVVRVVEDGVPYLDVIHPEHCYEHQEAQYHFGKEDIFISGGGDRYTECDGVVVVEFCTCVWRRVVQDWYEASPRVDEDGMINDGYGLWWGHLYATFDEAVPFVEALPECAEVEVKWDYHWWQNYFGEHDHEFSWWIPKTK